MAKELVLDVVARKNSKDLAALATEFDALSSSVDKSTESTKKHTNFSAFLEDQLAKTRLQVKQLGEEFDKTGDKDVFAKLRGSQSNLQSLERIKKQLSTSLEDGAKDAEKQVQTSVMGAIISGALIASPALGSVLGAAVIGAGGLGLIGLGIAGQVKSPVVTQAFHELGTTAKVDLAQISSAFGPVLAQGAKQFGDELNKITPALTTIENRMAPLLAQLLSGGVSFFDKLLPGLDALSQAAGPVLGVLSQELPGLGAALSTMLQEISAGAPNAAAGLREIVRVADGLIIGIGKLVQIFELFPAPLQVASLAVGALAVGFILLAPRINAAKEALGGLLNNTLAADTKLGSFARNATKVAAALAAVQVASAALGSSASEGTNATADALAKYASNGDKASNITKHLDYDLGTLGSGGAAKAGNAVAAVSENLTGLGGVFDESLQHAKERIASIDAALAQEVQSGNAVLAAEQFNALADAAQKQGISIDDLKAGLPQFEDALAALNKPTQTQITAMGDMRDAAVQVADAEARLTAEFDKQANSLLSLEGANDAYQKGLNDLKDALSKNSHTLEGNTDDAIQNREAIRQQIQLALKARQAAIDHAGGVNASSEAIQAANKQYEENLKKLEDMSGQLHLSKADLDAIVGEYDINIVATLSGNARSLVNPDGSVTVGGHSPKLIARADGGPVLPGVPYLVGEKHPELFIPDVPGRILPNIPPPPAFAATSAAGGGTRVLQPIQLVTPAGRVVWETVLEFAANTGQTPANLWPSTLR